MAIAFADARKTYDDLAVKNGRVEIISPHDVDKRLLYTRCTTFINAISDSYALMQWEHRKVAVGLQRRPNLLLSVAAHADDVGALNGIITKAKEAAFSSDAADMGTAMHTIYEKVDRGQDPGDIPAEYVPDLQSYLAVTDGMRHDYIEQRLVLDAYKITGTPDNITTFPARHPRWKNVKLPDGRKLAGKTVIVDKKTGRVDNYSILKIAMQLAVYSRSWLYYPDGRRAAHGADTLYGLILHSPVGSHECVPIWVDLKKGWEHVLLCARVRESRNLGMKHLTAPFDAPEVEVPPIEAAILACRTLGDLSRVWYAHEHEWRDSYTALASDVKREILAQQDARTDRIRQGHIEGLIDQNHVVPAPLPDVAEAQR